MSSDHVHDHGSGQDRSRLAIAFGITAVILLVQVVGAVLTGSLALLVDSAHVLTDVGGLLVALVAASLVARPTTTHRTWGLRRAEVLAATAQSAVLLVVGVYVLVEGVRRLVDPTDVAAHELLVFGVVGLLGNVAAIIVLAPGRSGTLNRRAAFLEVVNDALGSVAVIAAAVVIELTGWTRADAVAGLLIGVLILPRTLALLRETIDVLLESTPRGCSTTCRPVSRSTSRSRSSTRRSSWSRRRTPPTSAPATTEPVAARRPHPFRCTMSA